MWKFGCVIPPPVSKRLTQPRDHLIDHNCAVRQRAGRGDEGQVGDEEAVFGRSDGDGSGRQQRGEQDGGTGAAEGRAEAQRDGGGTGQLLLEDP